METAKKSRGEQISIAALKAESVIDSCKNSEQLDSAQRFANNFLLQFSKKVSFGGVSAQEDVSDIYVTLCDMINSRRKFV